MRSILPVLLLAMACAPAAIPVSVSVDAERFAVGIVPSDDSVTVYVCGKGDDVGTYTRWFSGPLDRGAFSVEREGWVVQGDLDQAGGVGTLEDPTGVVAGWASAASGEHLAGGLWDRRADCRDGAVVSADGRLVGAWCDDQQVFYQVEPVDNLVPDTHGALLLRAIGADSGPLALERVLP